MTRSAFPSECNFSASKLRSDYKAVLRSHDFNGDLGVSSFTDSYPDWEQEPILDNWGAYAEEAFGELFKLLANEAKNHDVGIQVRHNRQSKDRGRNESRRRPCGNWR
jgi:hypothetical protein